MGKWLKSVVMYTDGASRGNPGPASIGVVFTNSKGDEIDTICEAIGDQTNNFAEYFAVLEGLRKALKNDVTHVHLKSDSEFLIKQLKGEYKVKSATILPLFHEAKSLIKKFKAVKLEHIRREKNKEADRLANKALDTGKEPMEFKMSASQGELEQATFNFESSPALTVKPEAIDVEVVNMEEEYLDEYRHVLDTVAREETHICFVKSPPREQSLDFFKKVITTNGVFILAKAKNRVVGWADITRGGEPRFSHRGWLGMGVLEEFRGQGVGTQLLEACIAQAEEKGFEQINLSVFGTNIAAISLYRKFGFRIDGVQKNASKYNGQYTDIVLMTLEI